MLKYKKCFTAATWYITLAAVKQNKNLKVAFENKEHTKERKSEIRFYLVSSYMALQVFISLLNVNWVLANVISTVTNYKLAK